MQSSHDGGADDAACHDVAVPMDVADVATLTICQTARENRVGAVRRDLAQESGQRGGDAPRDIYSS